MLEVIEKKEGLGRNFLVKVPFSFDFLRLMIFFKERILELFFLQHCKPLAKVIH